MARNEIHYTVLLQGQRIERTVQPGGEFRVDPGESLIEVWSEVAPSGLEALAREALVEAGRLDGQGLQPFQLLYNFANVAPMGAPVGPFGFVRWQTGPASGPDNEQTINGTTVEDLLNVARLRIEGYQTGPVPSRENTAALEGIQFAIDALLLRTKRRQEQGVEGTDTAHVPA